MTIHYASATATPVSPEAAAVVYARLHGDAIMAAHQAAVAELARRAEGDELAMQAIRMSAAMLHLAIGMMGGHQEAREAASSILGKLKPMEE